jgi:hypothetical protein
MKRLIKNSILVSLLLSPLELYAAPAALVSAYQEKARQIKLAQDPVWLKLLHVHKNIFNQTRSGVTDPNFFLSPKGARDSEAELNATLDSFFSSAAATDDSTLCRYPARRSWLDEKLNLSKDLPSYTCARFDAWKEKLAPGGGVSLIFASYYFNNPASMYGHTFLKLKRQGYEEGQGLLDYTVNYTAVTNSNNGMAFALKGLAGGYGGRFSTDPYYIKIQKYNNIEARDLWEYDLDLSSAEISRMVEHLWELGPVSITYFFFNKNCSYQLLPVLEVARPSLDLSSRFRFRAIPLDTLKEVLGQPGLVKKWTLRPSHLRAMLAGREGLTLPERDLAKEMARTLSTFSIDRMNTLPPDRQAKVLDSAFDYLRYKAGFFRDRPLKYQERERNLLLLRKDRPTAEAKPVSYPDVEPPHLAHGTGQIQLLTGADRNQSFQEISLRGALHDQEADPIGYIPGSELEMLRFRGRYADQTGTLNLEQATLIDVLCLSPRDPWVHPPSWRLWGGAEVARDLNIDPHDSVSYGAKGGSGFSFFLTNRKQSLWYGLWRAEVVAGHAFRDGYRLGAGGETGFILPVLPRLRVHVNASALRFPIGDVSNVVRYYGAASYTLKKNLELRLIGERQNSYAEVRGGLALYW